MNLPRVREYASVEAGFDEDLLCVCFVLFFFSLSLSLSFLILCLTFGKQLDQRVNRRV